ncbi:thyroid receptor-interacting protein 11 isoform X2 [Dermacentor silvarum]|uniref:thyroid receptor-interacting protein 11 isoform X2 n=1 Tax=Dermacentor silvarum TaxID=543639 RepID=UPI002101038D|nr:thyroid receptor-interacting protein 11 isoform X2 [Dermacentor silvarum]
MSWLGGTLSSLTSQISNLTSEVLLEGREELDDQGAQLQLFKGRLEQLEGCNATLRKEVSNGEGNELPLLLEQQRDRIQELERALSEAAIERQEEVATLQSHHARQLAEARLQQQQNMAAEADVPSSQQTSSADPQVPKPNAPVSAELLKKRESKDGACQTDVVPDSVVKQLLQEKQQLEASLVELDQQNQATLSQLLALKTKLEDENRHQAKELRKLKELENYRKPVSCQASQTDSTPLRTASVETESFTTFTTLSSTGVQTELVTETSRESPEQHLAGFKLEARLQENCQAKEEHDRNLDEAREKCVWLEQELASRSAREEELEKKLQELTASVKTAATNDVFGERQEGDGAAAQDTSTTAMASMEERLRSLQADKDRILSVMNEKSRESSSLKAEVHRLLGVVAQERQAAAKLRREKEQQVATAGSRESEDTELTRQALRNLSQLVRDRELEVEAEKQKNSTLLQLLRQCSPVDQDQLQELLEERESLAQRAALADEEQGRLKVVLQQKEGELSDLRAEVDRLTLDLGLVRLEVDSVTQKLEEKTSALAAVREEALALRQRIAELEMRVREHQRDQLVQQHSESQSSQDAEEDKADSESHKSLSKCSSGGVEPVGGLSSGALVQHWQTQAEQYQKQVQELQLKEAKLSKELERLRTHLIQMEESYTQEALQAESREESLRTRLMKLEEWARVSESAAQNATEQASQQVGNLAQQLAQAQSQQSALAEELRHSKASLANLQLVLDHFQTEKDREIQLLRSSYESQLSLEREKSRQLVALVTQKQEQLEGSRDALEAAERLSQQLDRREEVIAALKQQLSEREAEMERIRQEVHVVRSTTEGKVDKQIMKSLVLGYFSSPQGQRPEVVRLLARVLDFSRDEMDKAGISLGSQDGRIHIGWISGFFRKSTGAGTGTGAISRPLNRESFSALFVKFLQEESEPQKEVRLPVEAMALGTVSRLPAIKAAPKAAATNTPHLLLQPISESLPTLAPVTLAPEDSKSSATNSTAFLQEMLS